MKTLSHSFSRIISFVFHPLLIPTWGFLLLSSSGFYFSLLPWSMKRYLLLVVVGSTCLLPALGLGILSLNNKPGRQVSPSDRIMPLLFSGVFYYLGYMLLEKVPVFPVFNLFIIAAILVQMALIVTSLKWNLSIHATAIGALIGGIMGISFRLQENPVLILSFLILVAGMIGTSRLILKKHTSWEIYSGFLIGFVILNMVITLV